MSAMAIYRQLSLALPNFRKSWAVDFEENTRFAKLGDVT
jgi:hypothetical protein